MVIRDATPTDLPAILTIYNDAVINTTAVYDYQPRDLAAQERWFTAKQEQRLPVLVAEIDGAVAGFASYGPFRAWPAYLYTVENSIYVAPSRRGQGIGGRLLPSLIARGQLAGMHAMVAGIDKDNAVSIRLHELCGFDYVGTFRQVGWKFGRWLDLVFMQRWLDTPGAERPAG